MMLELRKSLLQYQLQQLLSFCQRKRNSFKNRHLSLSVFQYLENPHSAEEVATLFGWNPNATRRLLEALCLNKILKKKKNSQRINFVFDSIPESLFLHPWDSVLWSVLEKKQSAEVLLKDTLFSQIFGAAFVQNQNPAKVFRYHDSVVSRFFKEECIETSLRENRACPDVALGLGSQQIFDFYQMDPNLLMVYSEGFSAGTVLGNEFFVKLLPNIPGLSVLDIGGGSGELASMIAKQHPQYQSMTVYDLPQADQALRSLREQSAQKSPIPIHWAFGDMFMETKSGLMGLDPEQTFNMIVMGWILHDWNDEKNISLLKKAAHHLSHEGRLYILEKVKTEETSASVGLIDFCMLLMADGYERNLLQYQNLLEQAGFQLEQFLPCSVGRDVLIVRKK